MPPVIATSLSDPLYYLRNAEQVIKLCLRQYPHLLTPEERQHLQQFLQLTTASQALLVRLVMRKGTLFRTDKLNYHEVPNLMCALEELSAVGLATLLPAITLSELCQLTKREECRHLVQRLIKTELKANTRKADLIATLLSHYPTSEPQPLATWWPEAPFQVIELRAAALFERLRLMFFGNLHQDWSEFVLTELGLQQFETVPLTPDSQPFQTRAEVDLYLTLQHLLARVNEGEAIADIYPLLPAPVHCEWLEYRRNKVLYQLGRIAERQLELSLALNLYEQSSHREAYIRTLRLLEKQHPPGEVFAQATDALSHIKQPQARVILERIRTRCAKKAGLAYTPPPALPIPHHHQILQKPHQGRVEAAVIAHLSDSHTRLFHVENHLFNGLFALLFWPALFAPVRGAFFHPFQNGPADLYRPGFIDSRADWLTEGFAHLTNASYKAVIWARYQEKYGLSCSFIHWPSLSEELLSLALAAIPAAHLKAVFEYLLLDLRHHRKGMPDLIEVNIKQQSYRLLEVKGPGDRLQDHQQLWIQTMLQQGLPVSLYQVSWQS